ncbi:D-glycerate dehydrogenase [archaeon]|jgi:glyoxylate reductase|nr:D-glycerate dehydrogenase [archaeon]MBT6762340.1 D-glycerate dehydrogenase [archaeon]
MAAKVSKSKTTKPKVYITRQIPKVGIDILKKHFTVKVYNKNQAIPKNQLDKAAKWADALLTLLTEKIDHKFLTKHSHLKVIANYAVGYDNIDLVSATKNKIPITNTPGVLTDAVAEHTIALMLALSRRIVEADNYSKSHKYKVWQPMLLMGSQMRGKTLGIIGSGRIGADVAQKCYHAFGMKIMYTDMHKNNSLEIETNAKKTSLAQICKHADFISLHVPLLKSTHHLIGKKELSLMKKNAYLINTARGPVIDEKALLKALKNKQIKGAALDVFEFEPKITKGLEKLPNVILTPHIASATIEAREMMATIAAKNICAVLKGKKALNLVNKDLKK